MHGTTEERRPAKKTLWMGTALLLGLTVVMVAIGRIRPLTMGVAAGMAAAGAAGIMAMAWLTARTTAYPRWAWWATAGVMAAAMLASLFVTGDPAVWKKAVFAGAWMLPWFLLLMGTTARRRAAACAPAGRRAGWLVVGIGAVLSVLLLGMPAIVDRIFG